MRRHKSSEHSTQAAPTGQGPDPTDRPVCASAHPHRPQTLLAAHHRLRRESHQQIKAAPRRAGQSHTKWGSSIRGFVGHRSRGTRGRIRPDTVIIPTSQSERACLEFGAKSAGARASREVKRGLRVPPSPFMFTIIILDGFVGALYDLYAPSPGSSQQPSKDPLSLLQHEQLERMRMHRLIFGNQKMTCRPTHNLAGLAVSC